MTKELCYCGHPKERHRDLYDEKLLFPCFHCSCKDYAPAEGEEAI